MKQTVVGIIGGNGVAATNKLLELIETKYIMDGAFRDAHHPEMLIYQATQAPSRSMFLEGKGESFIPAYVEAGTKLKNAGADILCLCCNTAHYALDILQKEIKIPFVNLIEEVVLKAKQTKLLRFGLVAADGCLAGKVYEKQFQRIFPEAEIVYPAEEFQREVTRGICNIKNSNRFLPEGHPDRPKTIFEKVRQHLIEQGAEVVIMGCTDIRVDYPPPRNTRIVNSLEILSNKIYKITKNGK